MIFTEQSHEILNVSDNIISNVEVAGRTCYKSEDKITEDSASKFCSTLINRGHHAMIEFGDLTVRFITNRGVTHELVRHRLCSFAQESTRYVKYTGDMEFIVPVWFERSTATEQSVFIEACKAAEKKYAKLLSLGWSPQKAREVLPNALKTEIVMKGNVREWRHILSLRCAPAAHPQMQGLMKPLLEQLKRDVPVMFADI